MSIFSFSIAGLRRPKRVDGGARGGPCAWLRRLLVFYKEKKNVTPQCSAAYRGRHGKPKEIPIAGRAVRQATRSNRAPGRRSGPSTNKKNSTTTICDQHRLCKTKKNKNGAQKKKISGGRTPQDGNAIQEQNWDRERSPRRQQHQQKKMARDAAADGFRGATKEQKKTPNALRRAEAGDTQRTREVPEERPSSVSRWLPMCPLRPC